MLIMIMLIMLICIAFYVHSSSIHLIHISTTNSYINIIPFSVVTWAVASNAGAFLSSRTLLKISATVYNRKKQTLHNMTLHDFTSYF